MTDASSLQQLLDDIRAHIAAGRKIEAIKLYCEATGAGLAEAKKAVELIEAGKPPKSNGSAAQPSDDQLRHIKGRIAAGYTIDAIKLYREATGAGLKEAKDAVEALAHAMPQAVPGQRTVDATGILPRDAGMRRMLRFLVLALLILAGAIALLIALSQF